MHADLVKLLDLQAKDIALREVEQRVAVLDAEGAELDAAVSRSGEAVEAARRAAQDSARRRDELETRIEAYRKLQEHRRQRLEFVRGAKEASALMAELDQARLKMVKDEGDWFRSAEVATDLAARVGQSELDLEAMKLGQEPARADLAARRAALEAERLEAQSARDAAAALLDRPLRVRYDRLWASRATRVVVALDGAACGACYTAVPLNRRSQIKTGLLIEGCESCGVILYSPEAVG